MSTKNPVVINALHASGKKVVCNGIGDCFSDAVYNLESAFKSGKASVAKSFIRDARNEIAGSYGVMHYDYATKKDEAYVKKCVAAIDKAMSSPTEENIKAARWECEKARAYADGNSPNRSFWS